MVEAARSYAAMDILTTFGEDQTISATGYMQEDAADKVLTIGAGRVDGTWVIIASAIEIASNNELYTHRLIGSNVADFASGLQVLCTVAMGATEALPLGAGDTLIGRFDTPFSNSVGGVEYKYVKHHVTVAGTIATGIEFTSFLSTPRDS